MPAKRRADDVPDGYFDGGFSVRDVVAFDHILLVDILREEGGLAQIRKGRGGRLGMRDLRLHLCGLDAYRNFPMSPVQKLQ